MGMADAVDKIRLKIEELLWELKQRAGKLPREKIKLFARVGLAAVAALVVIIVVTSIVISASVKNEKKETFDFLPPDKVAAEDFFLPPEPDFLPPVLLERAPRLEWTAEDAAPFWTDPASLGEGIWQQKVREYVDKLLESVP
jgi:hypothetical protein